ncbi:undecaprenyl-diphosphate phosphatase [Loktanella sp. SALINAS62]|uniref:undecaprenyl-diphosphate phosphatase n=1 Tax=Loktanella sp. SALINAS62 TaxID=2706124 RepID=UPI001B8CC51D|nr:undecaprenyl-diphosphate phosphatase [Loktanella sp. SALINAS62]MBS1301800.1 undecaprenyl-diphosphate phosphatase [Loktanella sp. SALINAS62]
MTLFTLVLVALVQGITEFLPVSSSGHLILIPYITGEPAQGLVIDVAAHLGTLVAVILFFWADVRMALAGLPRLIRGKVDTQGAWLALCLIIATIPVIVAGLILKITGLADVIRDSMTVIALAFIIFGIVLYRADQTNPEDRTATQWTLKHAVIMGLWQVVALIPGASRSGVTITGARTLGYNRSDAARLSMLMSIPTILASGSLLALDVIGTTTPQIWTQIAIVAGLSCLAALAALSLMMRLLKSVSYTPYVIYRIVLGVILLIVAMTAA